MLNGKQILAIVPARGGSKGVTLKNIRPVLGIPLLAYTSKLIQSVSEIDRAVVSTDHIEIAKVARESGLDAPFLRPESISGDFIGDVDVLTHALLECEKSDARAYDIVLMLQPTSPLRTAEDIRSCLKKLIDEKLDSVWTVSEVDVKYNPLKQLVLENGLMRHFSSDGKSVIARQQLGRTFIRNGVAYALTRDCLLNQKSLMGNRASAVTIAHPIVNIDTLNDFQTLEGILKTGEF